MLVMIGLGLGVGIGMTRQPVPAGALPFVLPVAPAARWHPQYSAVTTSGGRVVAARDLMGLAAVSEGAVGAGPRVMTDGAGRRFWRFEGTEFLTVAASLAAGGAACAMFMVGRFHRVSNTCPVFSLGNAASGTKAMMLSAQIISNSAPLLRAIGNYPRDGLLANANRLVAGSQMQVVGVASRGSGGGGTAIWLNRDRLDNGRNDTGTFTGAEIGRNSGTPGGSGTWGAFDLYEMAVYTQALTNAQGLAIQTALQDAYAIPDVTAQLVLEGDSITQGTGLVTPGIAGSMVLTEPGTTHIPGTWRVVNMAKSGDQVASLVARRDAAGGWPAMLLPGTGNNVLAFEIGRNDWVAGGKSVAQHYAAVVAYINTATTGVLQRGWTVRTMANIACAASVQPSIEAHRALLRNAQFLTDTASGAGQIYAGRVSVVPTDLVEHAGARRFFSSDQAGDTAYYAGDFTHPSILGAAVRVTGGDTPQYGVAAGL